MAGRNDPLKGKSVSDLANMDINEFAKLNRDELARVVTRLSSAANKRLRGMQKDDTPSPARAYAERSGGKFSTMIETDGGRRKRTLNELRSEFSRVTGFLNAKTSSRAGFRKVQREMEDRLGMPRDTPQEEKRAFWRVWNKLPERPFFTLGSEASQSELYDVFKEFYNPDTDYDDEGFFANLLNNVKDAIKDQYRQIGMGDVREDPSDYVRV